MQVNASTPMGRGGATAVTDPNARRSERSAKSRPGSWALAIIATLVSTLVWAAPIVLPAHGVLYGPSQRADAFAQDARPSRDSITDPRRPVPALSADGPVSSPRRHGETGPIALPSGGTDTTVEIAQAPVEPLAQGQAAGDPADGSVGTGAGAIRRRLEQEILRLEDDVAELSRLAGWQEQLVQAARTDPQGALRQRRPFAECLETPLRPFCDRLTGMFRQEGQ